MGKAAEIEILKTYDPVILEKCRQLDRRVYKEEYIVEFAEESAIVQRNPRSRIICWYKGELVGYYEYTPLTTEAFDTFLHTRDQLFDLLITEDSISPWIKGQPVDIYVGSIVVSPDFQGKMISLVLMRGFLQSMRELEQEGYRIGRIGGTGVSSGGVYSMKTYLDGKILHEVPGGTAMACDSSTAIARLDEYVGF